MHAGLTIMNLSVTRGRLCHYLWKRFIFYKQINSIQINVFIMQSHIQPVAVFPRCTLQLLQSVPFKQMCLLWNEKLYKLWLGSFAKHTIHMHTMITMAETVPGIPMQIHIQPVAVIHRCTLQLLVQKIQLIRCFVLRLYSRRHHECVPSYWDNQNYPLDKGSHNDKDGLINMWKAWGLW